MAHCKADMPVTNNAAGEDLSTKSKVLETGAAVTQVTINHHLHIHSLADMRRISAQSRIFALISMRSMLTPTSQADVLKQIITAVT